MTDYSIDDERCRCELPAEHSHIPLRHCDRGRENVPTPPHHHPPAAAFEMRRSRRMKKTAWPGVSTAIESRAAGRILSVRRCRFSVVAGCQQSDANCGARPDEHVDLCRESRSRVRIGSNVPYVLVHRRCSYISTNRALPIPCFVLLRRRFCNGPAELCLFQTLWEAGRGFCLVERTTTEMIHT